MEDLREAIEKYTRHLFALQSKQFDLEASKAQAEQNAEELPTTLSLDLNRNRESITNCNSLLTELTAVYKAVSEALSPSVPNSATVISAQVPNSLAQNQNPALVPTASTGTSNLLETPLTLSDTPRIHANDIQQNMQTSNVANLHTTEADWLASPFQRVGKMNKAIYKVIPKFEGNFRDNPQRYMEIMESKFNTYGVNLYHDRLLVLSDRLDDRLDQVFKNNVVYSDKCSSWSELRTQFLKLYRKENSCIVVMKQLLSLQQRINQGIDEFITIFDEKLSALVIDEPTRIWLGSACLWSCGNARTKTHVTAYHTTTGVQSLNQLYAYLRSTEVENSQLEFIKKRSFNQFNHNGWEQNNRNAKKRKFKQDTNPISVKNPKKHVKCHICKKQGHLASECRSKVDKLNLISNEEDSNLPQVPVRLNDSEEILAIVDTGATRSFIYTPLLEQLELKARTLEDPIPIMIPSGEIVFIHSVLETTVLKFSLKATHKFLVYNHSSIKRLIIGMDLMPKIGIKLSGISLLDVNKEKADVEDVD
jgi:hypothetical protein